MIGQLLKHGFALKVAALICVICILHFGGDVSYAKADSPPQKSAVIVDALKAQPWQEVQPGFDAIRAITQEGLVFSAYRFSPKQFELSIELQSDAKGERVDMVGERIKHALLVVNAGFFFDQDSKLYSTGYLRLGGKTLSKGWRDAGGFLSLKADGPELSAAKKGTPIGDFDVLQSKPMLIEPDGKWAMLSNRVRMKRRTILCRMSNGEFIIAMITRVGASLFEAGWIMRSKDDGGYFGCDSALAMDGGGSSQIWVRGYPQFSHRGLTPVHNFLVVSRKK